jgi:hypothetical protein
MSKYFYIDEHIMLINEEKFAVFLYEDGEGITDPEIIALFSNRLAQV